MFYIQVCGPLTVDKSLPSCGQRFKLVGKMHSAERAVQCFDFWVKMRNADHEVRVRFMDWAGRMSGVSYAPAKDSQ